MEQGVQVLEVSEVLQPFDELGIVAVVFQIDLFFELQIGAKLLAHQHKVGEEDVLEFIWLWARFKLVKDFKQIHLGNLLIAVGVIDVKGYLHHKLPIFEYHFNLLAESVKVNHIIAKV